MSGTSGGAGVQPDPADVEATPKPAPPVLKHFEFGHLPADLAAVSKRFHALAWDLAGQFHGDELETALNKLVEAKDWAVRAALAQRLCCEKGRGQRLVCCKTLPGTPG